MCKSGVKGYVFLGLVLCVTLCFSCTEKGEALVSTGDGQVPASEKAAQAARTSDPYVGVWLNLKNSSKGLSIQPEGDAYVVENEKGEKYVGTKTDGILRISGPIGSIDVLHIKSSDHLVAAGVEYRRFDQDGPEGQAAALRSAQKRTMADMRSIATAWEARATDTNSYSVDGIVDGEISFAQLGAALSPVYANRLPRDDGWKTPFTLRVSASGAGYSIRSFGANRRFDETPAGGTSSPEADILFANGSFVSFPAGK